MLSFTISNFGNSETGQPARLSDRLAGQSAGWFVPAENLPRILPDGHGRLRPKLPYWMRAGLAQFYSTLKPGDGVMKPGGPPTCSYHIHGTGQVDLTELFKIDRKSYIESRGKGAEYFGADTDHSTSHGNAALGNSAATNALNALQGAVTQDNEGPSWTLTHMLMFRGLSRQSQRVYRRSRLRPGYRCRLQYRIRTVRRSGRDRPAVLHEAIRAAGSEPEICRR